jgi:hypothetical protein
MVHRIDAPVSDGEAPKVHPCVDGGAALIDYLAGFGIEGMKNSPIGIVSPFPSVKMVSFR